VRGVVGDGGDSLFRFVVLGSVCVWFFLGSL